MFTMKGSNLQFRYGVGHTENGAIKLRDQSAEFCPIQYSDIGKLLARVWNDCVMGKAYAVISDWIPLPFLRWRRYECIVLKITSTS